MERVLAVLREEIPEFQWLVQTLAATDYKLPQTRVRVFLTGVRSSFCGGIVPRCLHPFGKSTLREFVDEGLPNTPRTELTKVMALNLRTIEQKVKAGIKSGVVPADALIIAPIDRAEGKAYKQRYLVNVAPTLTCHNKYLFLLSAADISLPDEERSFHRFLRGTERLSLQGFPASVAESLCTKLQIKASGNAYPTTLMAAVLAPIIAELAKDVPKFKDWGQIEDFTKAPSQTVLTLVQKINDKLQGHVGGPAQTSKKAKGKVVKKRPAANNASTEVQKAAANNTATEVRKCPTKNNTATQVKKRPAKNNTGAKVKVAKHPGCADVATGKWTLISSSDSW